ncbi:hypothetical protein CY35_03G006100 [Sphagnum magellanicum]|nr:hypothetical protein CY35_03G006100 [Sphagnum magellanicum]
MRIRKRQQRGAPASAAAPNTSSSDVNLPVSFTAAPAAGRVEESVATIEPLNVNPGVQEQTAVVRELAEQVEIQAVHESSSGTLVGEELSQSSTRPGSFTWLDKLWHTKGFQPAEPHVGLEEYLSSWNVGQKSISFAGESSAIAPASSTFPLSDVSPKAAGEQQGLLKLQREESFHAGEETSAGEMIIGEKLEPAIASNQSIKNTAISVFSGSLAPVPHAASHAIQRYNSCASGTDSTPTIIATSEHRQSSTVPRAMISLTGSSGSDVNLVGEPSFARDSDVVDHRLRSDASLPKPVSDVQTSVVLVQEADIEARTQAASIQVAIDSQLAIGRKADRPRQLEDDVALADPAGSEEARSGRGLIGQIVERSSKSSDDPGCRGIAHQQVEEGGVETLQGCVTSRYEPTKMTAIKTWQTDITAAAASSDLAIARKDSEALVLSRTAGRITPSQSSMRLSPRGINYVQSTIPEEDIADSVVPASMVATTASLQRPQNHDDPANIQPPKDMILERSMHKVFFQAGKSGLTAREAVSKILEQGLAGIHEGGVVVSRMQVGKLLRSSPYFMELEEGRFALCSAVIEDEEDIQAGHITALPHDSSSKFKTSHNIDKAMPSRAPKMIARHNEDPLNKETTDAPIDNISEEKDDRDDEANVDTVLEVGSCTEEETVRALEPPPSGLQESSIVGGEVEVAQERRRRKRLKTITQEGVSGLGNQCNRTDGKGWVCPLRAKVGYQLCDHHLNRLNDKGKSKSEN